MKEIWFERAGTKLFAVEDGQGAPVVFLHGGLANHKAAWSYALPLTASNRVITPDVRGSDRSRSTDISWDALVDDVAALLDHLSIDKAIIGGASFGCAVATRFAIRYPDRTRGLVAMQPAFTYLPRTPVQRQAMQAQAAFAKQTLTDGMPAMFPLLEHIPPQYREQARATIATYDPATTNAVCAFQAEELAPFTAEELASIRVPVLLQPGADPMHPPEAAETYRVCDVRTGELAAYLSETNTNAK